MKKAIGTRIRKIRESKDLTQDNMAAELGITAGAYAKIERGETDPSATRLIQIAEILEVDVMMFFRDASAVGRVEEPNQLLYGYASKHDVDNLAQLVSQLSRDLEFLKSVVSELKRRSEQ